MTEAELQSLGGLEHLLPVSFVLNVLTPVTDRLSRLQDTKSSESAPVHKSPDQSTPVYKSLHQST